MIDIDEYLTFAQGAHHAQAFFAELLYRHAGRGAGLPDGGLFQQSEVDFVQAAFASDAFTRYVEGSEGLPRDSLEIAQKCASLAIDRQISLPHVNTACMGYFLQSKEGRLSAKAVEALREIIRRCVEAETRRIALRLRAVTEQRRRRALRPAPHSPGEQGVSLADQSAAERFDMFLVDLGCFVERINKGQLRLVDHGLRRPGHRHRQPGPSWSPGRGRHPPGGLRAGPRRQPLALVAGTQVTCLSSSGSNVSTSLAPTSAGFMVRATARAARRRLASRRYRSYCLGQFGRPGRPAGPPRP